VDADGVGPGNGRERGLRFDVDAGENIEWPVWYSRHEHAGGVRREHENGHAPKNGATEK
jgi:hypothetical protein